MSTEQERKSTMWRGYSRSLPESALEEYFSRGRKLLSITVNGIPLDRVRFGEDGDDWAKTFDFCPECGAQPGMVHVPPCDIESCPNCKGQLLSCSCHVATLGPEWEQFERERQYCDEVFQTLGRDPRRDPPKNQIN